MPPLDQTVQVHPAEPVNYPPADVNEEHMFGANNFHIRESHNAYHKSHSLGMDMLNQISCHNLFEVDRVNLSCKFHFWFLVVVF